MAKLCSKFDLNPPHLSPIPTKPTSIFSHSYRISCSNRTTLHNKCKVSTLPQQTSDINSSNNNNASSNCARVIGRGVVGLAAALAVCVSSPALAESLTVAFPVSRAHEVNMFLFGRVLFCGFSSLLCVLRGFMIWVLFVLVLVGE